MRNILIKDKLQEMGINVDDINLGDFDQIGEFTAKKNRQPDSELYKKVGCFFRPNYERGILLYYLISKNNISSVLEIGFGRGYGSFCMAKAMCDMGIDGKITTVDPSFNQDLLNYLSQIFPKEWFEKIEFVQSKSEDYYIEYPDKKFDLAFIDGDHRYEAVKKDWEYAEKNVEKLILFDDYHLPSKKQRDIEVSWLIDEIEGYEKELIIGDRRIFFDDRRLSDEEIDYGQVLIEASKGE